MALWIRVSPISGEPIYQQIVDQAPRAIGAHFFLSLSVTFAAPMRL
jgi:hypothetical protein